MRLSDRAERHNLVTIPAQVRGFNPPRSDGSAPIIAPSTMTPISPLQADRHGEDTRGLGQARMAKGG